MTSLISRDDGLTLFYVLHWGKLTKFQNYIVSACA